MNFTESKKYSCRIKFVYSLLLLQTSTKRHRFYVENDEETTTTEVKEKNE